MRPSPCCGCVGVPGVRLVRGGVSASCARWSECVLCEVWLVPSVFCTECVAGFRLQASAVVHSFVSHGYMLV